MRRELQDVLHERDVAIARSGRVEDLEDTVSELRRHNKELEDQVCEEHVGHGTPKKRYGWVWSCVRFLQQRRPGYPANQGKVCVCGFVFSCLAPIFVWVCGSLSSCGRYVCAWEKRVLASGGAASSHLRFPNASLRSLLTSLTPRSPRFSRQNAWRMHAQIFYLGLR